MATFDAQIASEWEQFEASTNVDPISEEDLKIVHDKHLDDMYLLMQAMYAALPQLFSHPPKPPRKRP